MGRGGDPAALRLEPEQAAERTRDPDRAAAVAAHAGGHHAGGHRHRRTSAGAARRARAVPGVAGDAAVVGLGVGPGAELGHRGLADHDRAGRPESADHLAVGRHRGAVAAAAEGGHRAGDVELLLDGDRDAVQRAERATAALRRVACRRLGERLPLEHHREGIESGVVLTDPRQRGLDLGPRAGLPRRDPAGGLRDARRLARDVQHRVTRCRADRGRRAARRRVVPGRRPPRGRSPPGCRWRG